MSGHVVKQSTNPITEKTMHLSIQISAAQRARLVQDGRLLISYETTKDEVQAFDLRLKR
jgi:hypothetical protein